MEKIYVNDDELTVLRLYRKCEQASFTKRTSQKSEALEFASILGEPGHIKYDDNVEWYGASYRKIQASAFIRKDNSNE